jgi:hypothetical protein
MHVTGDETWIKTVDAHTFTKEAEKVTTIVVYNYLVVVKVTERLAVSKQTTHRVLMEKFNLKKLNEVGG